jgi:succinyldiaminopimelate transaminase
VQAALAEAADSHGYPQTMGTPELRDAIVAFLHGHRGVGADVTTAHVLPVIGSKELVAHLPFQLGIGPGDTVAFPHVAYPTYDMGARFVGADALPLDMARLAVEGDAAVPAEQRERIRLLWLNSPGNPTGEVLDIDQLRAIRAWARENDVVIASDECYALLPWEVREVPSILDPRVTGGDLSDLLCTYSLSKQSNLAGYRAAFVAGDADLVGELLAVRKQAGMILPGPVQHAMAVALADLDSVRTQVGIYGERRRILRAALEGAGGVIHGSQAGLYLWTAFPRIGPQGLDAVDELAARGILVAPGVFYGEAGAPFVRIALTASDERIRTAAERLASA